MKKLVLVALAALMALSLMACDKTCKVEGCEKPVYEDGYCELHLLKNEIGNLFGGE